MIPSAHLQRGRGPEDPLSRWAVEQRAIVTVSRAIRRECPGGFIEFPPTDQTVITGPYRGVMKANIDEGVGFSDLTDERSVMIQARLVRRAAAGVDQREQVGA